MTSRCLDIGGTPGVRFRFSVAGADTAEASNALPQREYRNGPQHAGCYHTTVNGPAGVKMAIQRGKIWWRNDLSTRLLPSTKVGVGLTKTLGRLTCVEGNQRSTELTLRASDQESRNCVVGPPQETLK